MGELVERLFGQELEAAGGHERRRPISIRGHVELSTVIWDDRKQSHANPFAGEEGIEGADERAYRDSIGCSLLVIVFISDRAKVVARAQYERSVVGADALQVNRGKLRVEHRESGYELMSRDAVGFVVREVAVGFGAACGVFGIAFGHIVALEDFEVSQIDLGFHDGSDNGLKPRVVELAHQSCVLQDLNELPILGVVELCFGFGHVSLYPV